MAVKALLSDPDYQQAGTAMVRDNSFGHLAVLLAVSGAGKRFTISTWMVDKGATIQKNITANSVEDQVRWQVDAYDFDSEYDVGILVQDPYVSAAVTLYEASFLVTNSRSGVGYLVSHKNNGTNTLLRTLTTELGITGAVLSRGLGGVRVLKLRKERFSKRSSLPVLSFSYSPKPGVCLSFLSTSSLFSPDQVDPGSRLLISYVLGAVRADAQIVMYDVGCGYGVIGLSLAACLQRSSIVISDADARAADFARKNTARAKLDERVTVVLSDGPRCVQGEFDLVLSNPPLHTQTTKLLELIRLSAEATRRGGKMLMVLEDSRVPDIKASIDLLVGSVEERARTPSHVVLQYTRPR